MISLFEINPAIDRASLRHEFAKNGRVQIRDVLTSEAARNLRHILMNQTQWGLSWQAGEEGGPNSLKAQEIAAMPTQQKAEFARSISDAMRGNDYGFVFSHYPMLNAYLEQWDEGSPHDILLEHLNSEPFLSLVRDITAIPELIKADGQATLFAPGQFLAQHNDSHVAEGWRVAYVLNMGPDEWRPDWGGYLQFLDEDGDITGGYKPRFNSLNMFAVPQSHNVSYVPPFAPHARVAVTGWVRDR